MKILLLNDNPVVNKLVTLSAQKTSDELEVVSTLSEIEIGEYDLLIIDDAKFHEDVLHQIKEKINFNESLYICSRDAKLEKGFTTTLKKPFLPTDLVELFSTLGKKKNGAHLSDALENDTNEILDLHLEPEADLFADTLQEDGSHLIFDEEEDLLDGLEGLQDMQDLGEIEDLQDDTQEGVEHLDFEEELILDSLDDASLLEEDAMSKSVLDKDELREVQDLLEDETDDALEEEINEDFSFDEDLMEELQETPQKPEEVDQIEEMDDFDDFDDKSEDDFELEEIPAAKVEDQADEEIDFEEIPAAHLEDQADEEIDFEEQISSAVGELSEEELESQVDEETLLDIAMHEIGGLESLTQRDLKLAIGEEVEPQGENESAMRDSGALSKKTEKIGANHSQDEGVASLKRLLEALSNEGVAASLKGMKISVNITFGDQ